MFLPAATESGQKFSSGMGRFASLWRGNEEEPVELTVSELQLFLEGSVYVGRVSLSPPIFEKKSLAKVLSI